MTLPDSNRASSDVYPNLRQAIWLLFLLYLVSILLYLPIGIPSVIFDTPLPDHPFSLLLPHVLAFVWVFVRAVRRVQAPLSEVFPLPPIQASLLWPIALAVLGIQILSLGVDVLVRRLLPELPRVSLPFRVDTVQNHPWVFVSLLVMIAPVTEEPLFRGLMLRGFLRNYGERKAIVASAFLFGISHLDPVGILGSTAAGIFLAWLAIRTSSLLPCLFAHFVMNAMVLLSFLEVRGVTFAIVYQQPRLVVWLFGFGLASTVLGIWLLRWKVKIRQVHFPQNPA